MRCVTTAILGPQFEIYAAAYIPHVRPKGYASKEEQNLMDGHETSKRQNKRTRATSHEREKKAAIKPVHVPGRIRTASPSVHSSST
jgi:hypothetical protein